MAAASEHSNSSERTSGSFDLFASWQRKEEKESFLALVTDQRGENWKQEDDDQWIPLVQDGIGVEDERLEKEGQPEEAYAERNGVSAWGGLSHIITSLTSSGDEGESNDVETLLQKARHFADTNADFKETKSGEDLNMLRDEINAVLDQLRKSFDHVAIDKINPMAFLYYLEHEDSIKTPSWKRRRHRFLPPLDMTTVNAMHDALYLAELSYCDSVGEIQAGLDFYEGSPYEMIFCTAEGFPRQPAHYIAIQRDLGENPEKGFSLPWQKKEKCLEVLLVVRGTKELADLLSDALLETADYRGGKAHNGIAKAGQWLVEKHTPLLEHLLEESKRNKIRLTLIGHSLGAGAAAIAAAEFNDHPQINATAIGFGCPALMNKELSESTKDYITTVVSDSDVVPRMSGSTVANVLLDLMSLDWTEQAVDDMSELMRGSPVHIPENKIADAVHWARDEIGKSVKASMESASDERSDVILYPPGKCVHLYRDGVGVSASYVPCDFFTAVDVSRTMVEDHYIATGYNKLLLELMRGHKEDSKFEFRHDVAGVRIEKDKRVKSAKHDDVKEEEEKLCKAA